MARFSLKPLVVPLLAGLLCLAMVLDVALVVRIYQVGLKSTDPFLHPGPEGGVAVPILTEEYRRRYLIELGAFVLAQIAIAAYLWKQWRGIDRR